MDTITSGLSLFLLLRQLILSRNSHFPKADLAFSLPRSQRHLSVRPRLTTRLLRCTPTPCERETPMKSLTLIYPTNSDDPKIAAYLLVGGHVQLPLALISYGENCSIGEIESGIRHTPGADAPLSGLYSVVAWASRSSAALCPSASMNDLT